MTERMTPSERAAATKGGKAPKGSKAACEAAGWKFAPLASIHTMPSTFKGVTTTHRYRREGGRGVMVIPPFAAGIEPKQFSGAGLAVAWAVQHLGDLAQRPQCAPAGLDGIKLLLSASLASGLICGGGNETPERPDGLLLALCNDAISASCAEDQMRVIPGTWSKAGASLLTETMKVREKALRDITELHAVTKEGLLQKARVAAQSFNTHLLTATQKHQLMRTLIEDLIHIVPTIDERSLALRLAPRPRPRPPQRNASST